MLRDAEHLPFRLFRRAGQRQLREDFSRTRTRDPRRKTVLGVRIQGETRCGSGEPVGGRVELRVELGQALEQELHQTGLSRSRSRVTPEGAGMASRSALELRATCSSKLAVVEDGTSITCMTP